MQRRKANGITYTVILLHERDGRYSAIVPALECASWGHNIPEALRMVEEAIELHLEALQAHGEPIPQDASTFPVDMGDASDAVIYKVTVQKPEAVSVG
jgi:antitoxin HicB